MNRYEEALAAYDAALKLNPDDPSTLGNQGVALALMGRNEEALAAFDRSLELRPSHFATHYNRGVVLSDLGRHEEAVAAYGEALKRRRDDPGTLNNRGVALARLGRHREAAASHKKAARAYKAIGAPDTLSHVYRGIALYQQTWFRELHLRQAVEEFRLALRLDEKSLPARNGLGVCLLDLGQPAAAAVEFLRAAEQARDDPDHEAVGS